MRILPDGPRNPSLSRAANGSVLIKLCRSPTVTRGTHPAFCAVCGGAWDISRTQVVPRTFRSPLSLLWLRAIFLPGAEPRPALPEHTTEECYNTHEKELPKVYEPQEVESRVYETWEKNSCFKSP